MSANTMLDELSLKLWRFLPALLLVLALVPIPALSQAHVPPPTIQWQKCFGGTSDDWAYCIIQTSDGGFAFCGYTTSTDGNVVGHHDGLGEDAWVVKLSASGDLQWQKCLGGTWNEEANSIAQTADGGFIVAVRTESDDGDVHGYIGQGDAWIVKLSDSGEIEWSQIYGGDNADDATSILVTAPGDYVFAGFTRSLDNAEAVGKHGEGDDAWVVKINTSGVRAGWQKCLGGSERDIASSIVQTSDGGYVVAGYTDSKDGDLAGYKGTDTFYDAWIVKLGAFGNIQWQRRLGGAQSDWANAAIQMSDGGYAVAGVAYSNDRDVSGNHGGGDAWVIRLDDTGAIEWQNCLGGTGYDAVRSIVETPDGGFIAAGFTSSMDSDIKDNHGSPDILLVKLSALGELEWEQCLGGTGVERGYSIIRTLDGGYAVAGYASSMDGDVSGGHGGYDAWIVKLGTNADVAPAETATPNGGRSLGLRVVANADSKSLAVDFNLPPSSSETLIDISNVTGAHLQEIRRSSETGHHEESLDISNLIAGTYFVTLRSGNLSQTVPVQIVW